MGRNSTVVSELQEYADNDFIRGLPPILSTKDCFNNLSEPPIFDPLERTMAPELRRHCVLRLGRYYEPLPKHVELSEKIEMLIRQGYVGRNPRNGGYLRQIHRSAKAVRSNAFGDLCQAEKNTASGFCLIGCSGIGKSKCIEKILSRYETVISHRTKWRCEQVTFVKLDCPHRGSEHVLCDSFFLYLDRLLGTDYYRRHGAKRATIGGKLLAMAHLAVRHAVGVLIIDEIQHLNAAVGGAEALLNFMVTLENTIGIPILLVGTLAAVPLMQGTFRQARRVSGFGSVVWDRMPPKGEWTHFARRLWSYQWTHEETPWTGEIDEALYDESQGIKDIAIKMVMMCQFRMIKVGETKGRSETMPAALVRTIALEEFQIVRPMIDALRRNDKQALISYDDLLPLNEHFNMALARAVANPTRNAGVIKTVLPDETQVMPPKLEALSEDGLISTIRASLEKLGVATDTISAVIAAIGLEKLTDDPLAMMAAALRLLREIGGSKPKPSGRKSSPTTKEKPALPAGDLRAIVASGAHDGLSAYHSLQAAGIVRRPVDVASLEIRRC
jgi:hypothetical protein